MPGITLPTPLCFSSTPTAGTSRTFVQRNVVSMFEDNSKDAFRKLTRTAYELAMNPTLSLNQFTTLVKVQRQNGVRLIQGMLTYNMYYVIVTFASLEKSLKVSQMYCEMFIAEFYL